MQITGLTVLQQNLRRSVDSLCFGGGRTKLRRLAAHLIALMQMTRLTVLAQPTIRSPWALGPGASR